MKRGKVGSQKQVEFRYPYVWMDASTSIMFIAGCPAQFTRMLRYQRLIMPGAQDLPAEI